MTTLLRQVKTNSRYRKLTSRRRTRCLRPLGQTCRWERSTYRHFVTQLIRQRVGKQIVALFSQEKVLWLSHQIWVRPRNKDRYDSHLYKANRKLSDQVNLAQRWNKIWYLLVQMWNAAEAKGLPQNHPKRKSRRKNRLSRRLKNREVI